MKKIFWIENMIYIIYILVNIVKKYLIILIDYQIILIINMKLNISKNSSSN